MIDETHRAPQAGWKTGVLLGLSGLLMSGQCLMMHAHADDRTGMARQQRTEAGGWLQLERDQAVNRERIGPLSPSASRGLESRERMERNDLRELNLRQRQRLQNQARKARLSRDSGSSRSAARGLDLRHQRQSDQLRLRMRMNRDIRR